ncbi:uncharacterized protein BO72DRAFT_10124 [Aspergillus fijiensis CBS 313.89]|uniref:Uncharacterized protein n=1 Tax=Aspergillus fijiensis CBS 313.89 TaxID=1448319 RepID=A0A8G1RZG2_9EURO|nr:uncharacterized protein BO72DRAFT_10124 [Aspergillus fijiensis CBS 313.89]RAK82777.1 hypothetical protein BO72DRAFT_10124 [Aspergillus fijiensis CBS 313.89]
MRLPNKQHKKKKKKKKKTGQAALFLSLSLSLPRFPAYLSRYYSVLRRPSGRHLVEPRSPPAVSASRRSLADVGCTVVPVQLQTATD